jgi:drug/metabolite transporter (DMT)-like permease
MAEAVTRAALLDADVLCEQFIEGDEVTCPVLVEGGQARALPVVRIMAPDGNYDYQNKYFTDEVQYLVPSGLPPGEEAAIAQLVLKAFASLGCRGWARADVMIDAASRRPYLLEMNTSPGMTGHSLVPMSARDQGLSYEVLCLAVLGYAAYWVWASATQHPLTMPFGPRPLEFVGLMVAIGLFASWLGTLCWNAASQRLPTALAGQLIVFETLSALAYAFWLRGQWPEPLTLAGIALLVVGVVGGVRVKAKTS